MPEQYDQQVQQGIQEVQHVPQQALQEIARMYERAVDDVRGR